MENEETLINELKRGFGTIGVTSLLAFITNLAFLIFQLSYLSNYLHNNLSHSNYYLIYIGSSNISSLLFTLIYFSFLYLSKKIDEIEKSKENTIFRISTTIAVMLIFFNIGLFLAQFLVENADKYYNIYNISYIILQICFIFVYIFFALSISKMNSKMEVGVIIWPIVIYATINSIGAIFRLIIQVFIILKLSSYALFTSMLYSFFKTIDLVVELIFIISMFFVANNAQTSSLYHETQYTPYAYSGYAGKSKKSINLCPFCGTENSPDSKFCINCGKKMN
ncbi:MAG: zinc ribbon domain-containing protein [Candidatus Heimdallarchaeum endolithica]|uniref:Zinc ribbon domain-containing protein n=1 Tax=Candidatus Heimdallarchaeum endolithica TaxID=2876572 RepID=A0A9Y1BR41_9ARCH|nr:MAG: zinc ribbon domain-containing protein [Candidatus Heimdallarchaeum endolithica]